MKTFQSSMLSTATLLVVFSSFAQCTVFMHNGKAYDDKFHQLFVDKAPVEKIIKLAASWDADKQLDHFDQLYHHINSNDKWANYAQNIINATRGVLQRALNEVGYTKKMNLEQYLIGAFQIQNDMKTGIDPDILEGIELLDKVDGDSFEKLLNSGGEEELEWELNNLHPYQTIVKPEKMVKIVEKSEKSKPAMSEEEQKSEGSQVSESQKSEHESVPEPQKSKELEDHVAEEQESAEQKTESEDQTTKPRESEKIAQEVEETTEKPLNEP